MVSVRSIDRPVIMAVGRYFIVTGAALRRFAKEFHERVIQSSDMVTCRLKTAM